MLHDPQRHEALLPVDWDETRARECIEWIVRGTELPEDLRRYTRKLTLFWALLVGILFALTLLLSFTGPLWLWSLHTNFLSYVVVGVVFVVEFFLRRIWFSHHHHLGFWQYLKRMTQIRGGQLR